MEEIVESRNKVQETAMQIMYGFLVMQHVENPQPIDFKETLETVCNKPYEECDIFLKELLIQALKNENEIIDKISSHLKNWKFDRLNSCVKSILIIALSNYFYCGNKEKGIVINVAVKLAKKYGEKDDYKFVNAILDNCLND